MLRLPARDDRVTPLKQRLLTSLGGFVTGSYITRDQCDRAFERMHERDRIGDRLHLAFACLAMLGIAGPVSVVDIAVLPLVVFFLVRVFNTFPVWIHGFGQPVVLTGLMLAALMGVSLLWSEDPSAGLEHIGELRWLAMIGFVYPVIEHRRVLIACLCIGFVIGNGAQVVDAFDGFGNPWLADRLWHEPSRMSGWWDPAVGGSLLVGALGLHLPAALMGKGRWRVVGILGSVMTVAALIATGTRGAWVASILLVAIALVIGAGRGKMKGRTLLIGGVAVVVLAIGSLQIEAVSGRVGDARSEIARAVDGDFESFTGARVSMANQAARAGAGHPFGGIGAGSFRHWMEERTQSVVDDQSHAHSMGLQLWAEHGVPGVLIGVLLVAVVLVNAWRCGVGDSGDGYSFGPFFAVVGLVLVGLFDSVLVNVNTAAMFGALAALSPAYLPISGRGRDPT